MLMARFNVSWASMSFIFDNVYFIPKSLQPAKKQNLLADRKFHKLEIWECVLCVCDDKRYRALSWTPRAYRQSDWLVLNMYIAALHSFYQTEASLINSFHKNTFLSKRSNTFTTYKVAEQLLAAVKKKKNACECVFDDNFEYFFFSKCEAMI